MHAAAFTDELMAYRAMQPEGSGNYVTKHWTRRVTSRLVKIANGACSRYWYARQTVAYIGDPDPVEPAYGNSPAPGPFNGPYLSPSGGGGIFIHWMLAFDTNHGTNDPKWNFIKAQILKNTDADDPMCQLIAGAAGEPCKLDVLRGADGVDFWWLSKWQALHGSESIFNLDFGYDTDLPWWKNGEVLSNPDWNSNGITNENDVLAGNSPLTFGYFPQHEPVEGGGTRPVVAFDACLLRGSGDADGDGIINSEDPDKDNDGFLNAADADPYDPLIPAQGTGPAADFDADGINNSTDTDDDDDGTPDATDEVVYNPLLPAQGVGPAADWDADGTPNVTDDDDDGDGTNDLDEIVGGWFNPNVPIAGGVPVGAGTGQLPNGMNNKVVSAGAAPTGNYSTLVQSWASLSPTAQSGTVLVITVPIPGSETPGVYTLSSMPDTSTAWGTALNVFRMIFRTALVCFVLYKFTKMSYALIGGKTA